MKLINFRGFITSLRLALSKFSGEVGSTNIFLLFLLAVITFYPLFSGGFTTHDDAYMAINEWNGLTWEAAKLQSAGQGRFVFFWGFPLSAVPFIVDSRIWYLAFKFGSFFVLLGTLYYAVFKIFRSGWIALVSMAIFLAILQNGWEHNALTSYAVIFNSYAAMFLLSLGLLASAIDRKSLILAGLSGGLYFFALGSELFVLFFPFYIAVVLSRVAPEESVLTRLRLGRNYILAIALPLLAYLVLYVVWRSIHPSNYEGNNLSGFNLMAAAKVVATYSLTAFPFASLHFYGSPGDPLSFTNSASLRAIVSELNVASLIKPAVLGFIFVRVMTAVNVVVPSAKVLLSGAFLACVGVFLPNLLLGFTARHQSWVNGGTHSYVYTYYSFISMVVFFALLLAYVKAKSASWHPGLKFVFMSLLVSVVAILGFAVEVRNQYFAFDQKLAHRKWQLLDVVIKSKVFAEIPDGATLFAPTLLTPARGYAAVFADDWSNYVKYKTGKIVEFTDKKCKIDSVCYVLVFRQEYYSDNQFVVLKRVVRPDSLALADLTIYSMPVRSGAVILGSFDQGVGAPRLKANGVPVVNVGNGLFAANFPGESGDGFVEVANMSGNVDIVPERITISHYNVQPRLRSFIEELADGVDFKKPDYPDFLAEVHGVSWHESWGRWTDAVMNPVAKFVFKQALPKKFILEITAGAFGPNMGKSVKVRVGSVVKSFVVTPEMLEEPCRLEFETDGTVDALELTSPSPFSPSEVDPKSSDARKLGIGLISLKIKSE